MTFLKRVLLFVAAAIIFLVVLLAAADNSDAVTLKFLDLESWAWPVSWWMMTAFVIGILVGTGLNLVSNTKLRLDARRAKKAADGRTRELDKVRAEVTAAE